MDAFSHQCKNVIANVIEKSHCIVFFLSNDILETMEFSGKWMELDNILGEVTQVQEDKHHIFPLICES